MQAIANLDILVVYSADLATSASAADSLTKHPFLLSSKQANYNLSYAYLLEMCTAHGLSAGFTASDDVIGPGTCQGYWTYDAQGWNKVAGQAQSQQIFDKLAPRNSARAAERQLLLSDAVIRPFNDADLSLTFFDKVLTYVRLPNYAIPTVAISSRRVSAIKTAIAQLQKLVQQLPFAQDFAQSFVLKDRYGSGGEHVYHVTNTYEQTIRETLLANPKIKFVLQPFLLFDQGFTYKGQRTATDIRILFHRNQILQTYVRMAKEGDFRCNEHQGGQLEYIDTDDVPQKVRKTALSIAQTINKPQSLYALDFAVSNEGRVYLMEGNSGPGIDWDVTKKTNETKSKQLIRSIVRELASRIE